MKNIYLIILCLIFLFNIKAQELEAELYITTSYTVAIFPDSFPIKGKDKRFTPSREVVDKGEKALSRDLFMLNVGMENQDRDNLIHRRLLQFQRQYFGYINDDGQRVIKIIAYVNANEEYPDLLTKERTIISGTSDNWVVYYNVDKNELYDLSVGKASTHPAKTIQSEVNSSIVKEIKLSVEKSDSTVIESRKTDLPD